MAELTAQQKSAVENRGGRLLVSAAAGSGKSTVLVERLLSYLTDPVENANLDDFLIITYTKAAAAELRAKIASKLSDRIAAEPGNRHLQQQFQRLYLAKISTVHSFCSDILREYAYRLDIPGDFRVSEENENIQLQYQAVQYVLEQAYSQIPMDPDFQAFVDSQGLGRDDRMVPEIVVQVFNSARCHMSPEKWLDECLQSVEVSTDADASQTVWGQYLIANLKYNLGMQIAAIRRCIDEANQCGGMENAAQLLEDTLQQMQRLFDSNTWDEICNNSAISYGTLRFPKQWQGTAQAQRIAAARNGCKALLGKLLRNFTNNSTSVMKDLVNCAAAARGLVKITRQFAQAYERLKRGRRILDFSDLEQKTLDLLLGKNRTGATAVAREIGMRFREVMVDEYQDSNEVQDAIFMVLTQQKKNCFMVGDVKQSIYQFRLADPQIFLEKYNQYVPADSAQPGQGRRVILSSNFRSSAGVISGVNDVFENCMTPQIGGLVYSDEEKLQEGFPHCALPDPEVNFCAIEVDSDTYAEEAAVVADKITELLDGKHMVRSGDTLRPIVEDDIVILLRAASSIGPDFCYALEQRGIRCTMGRGMDLMKTEEIMFLRSFLQVIGNPLQDIPLIAVLSNRVIGFGAEDLAKIRCNSHRTYLYQAMQSMEDEKCQAFLALLDELRREATLLNIPQLLERIFALTKLDSIFAAMPDGVQRTDNLQNFLQVAADYESSIHGDLPRFLDYLEILEARGINVNAQQNTSGCVTIMTIHKSKGLEFPVVFLSGLSHRINFESAYKAVLCDKELGLGLACVDAQNRVRYPSLAKRAIAMKIKSDSLSEEMRVLYVAMTRAKDRLFMTYAVPNLESDVSGIINVMDMYPKELLLSDVSCPGEWVLQTALRRIESGALLTKAGIRPEELVHKEPLWDISIALPGEDVAFVAEQDKEKKIVTADIAQQLRESLAFCYPHIAATQVPSKQTATQLKGRYKDQEAAEDSCSIKKPNYFRKPSFAHAQSDPTAYGTAMHTLMQYIRYENCGNADDIEADVQRLVQTGFLTQQQANMINYRAVAALFDSALGKKLRASAQVVREFKFSILDDASRYVEGLTGERVLLQGVVDCAIVEDDGITVIDFKTDKATEDTVTYLSAQYHSQVAAYADALSRIYQKPVKEAYLYFFHLEKFVNVQL